MNELLAIILIVLLCCFLFFAWLFALATCPDRMVNLISGTKQSSSPISRASEDLARSNDGSGGGQKTMEGDEGKTDKGTIVVTNKKKPGLAPLLGRSRSIPANRSNGFLAQLTSEKRSNSKKLSVVPEADEQLTVTSISQCARPLLALSSPRLSAAKSLEEGEALLVKTVCLNRHTAPDSTIPTSGEVEIKGNPKSKETTDSLTNKEMEKGPQLSPKEVQHQKI